MSENRPYRETSGQSQGRLEDNQGIAHFEVIFREVIMEVVDTETGI